MLTIFNPSSDFFKNIGLKDCLDGNSVDTFFTAKVYGKLIQEIRKSGLESLYENLIAPLAPVFRDIELEGILVDEERLQELKKELVEKIEESRKFLMDSPLVPQDINLGSNQDLCKIFFSVDKVKDSDGESSWEIIEGDVGFGLFPVSYTAKGAPKTDEESLAKLHELVEEEYVRRGLSGKK